MSLTAVFDDPCETVELGDRMRSWLEDSKKTVLLGIGNRMRGDDAIGIEIVKLLKGRVPRKVELLECQTAPEDFIKEISQYNPTHILIIDAAELDVEPGRARIIPHDEISGTTTSTHAIPLSILAEILKINTNAKVKILGVQPGNTGYGEELTAELKKASKNIADILARILSEPSMQPILTR